MDQGEHGVWLCPLEAQPAHAVQQDSIVGGQWFENGFSTPQKFYSHSEHRKALDREGFMIAPRYVENNKVGMTNWAAGTVDLEGATALVSRGSVRPKEATGPGGRPLLPPTNALPNEITVREAGWTIGVSRGE